MATPKPPAVADAELAQPLGYSLIRDDFGLATLGLRLIAVYLLLSAVGTVGWLAATLGQEFLDFSGGTGPGWGYAVYALATPAVNLVFSVLLLVLAPRLARWLRMGATLPEAFPLRQLAAVAVAVVGLVWLAYGVGEMVAATRAAATGADASGFLYYTPYGTTEPAAQPLDLSRFIKLFTLPLTTLLIGVVLMLGAKRIVRMLNLVDSKETP